MERNKLHRSLGLAAILVGLGACDPVEQKKFTSVDEASDEAFVRRAVPTLLGRQPLASSEVYGLLEILKASSRSRLVDVIMNRPEFADYWASVLIEDLKPELAGINTAVMLPHPDCVTKELLTTAGARKAAATWVAGNTPGSPFLLSGMPTAFSVRDLVKGAVLNDHLHPIYPAWIAMLTSTQGLKSYEIAAVAMDTLLNRNETCMACHDSLGSPTEQLDGGPGNPNRFYPHTDKDGNVIDLEGSILGFTTHGRRSFYSDLSGFFALDAAVYPVPLSPPAPRPPSAWGLYCSKGLGPDASNPTPSSFASHTGTGQGTGTLVAALKSGVQKLAAGPPTVDPITGLTDSEAAFAYMVASNVVDNVFEEVTGSRLTLVHGFSRTVDQRFLHAMLTAAFLGDDLTTAALEGGGAWSLRSLLKAMLLNNNLFNRNAPASSAYAAKYQLPMIANPWVLNGGPADSVHGVDANGQGDLVNHRSAAALFFSTSKSIGETSAFASFAGAAGSLYPTFDAAGELGAYVSSSQPANRTVNLNTVLAWSDRPAPSAGTWATRLDAVLQSSWVGGVSNRYRYNDLAIAVKDRVLAQPTLTASEGDLVRQMLGGVADMTAFVSQSWYTSGGRDKLLKYMALLQESPQFVQSGLPPTEALPPIYPDPTRLDVCLTGEPCSPQAWITSYGYTQPILSCGFGAGSGSGSGSGAASGCNSGGSSVNGKTCACDSACLAHNNCCFDKFDLCP
jgi:hypothetical protein